MRYKYPKTMHLPFSPGLQNDDRMIENLNGFVGHEIVVTEKRDGENTSLYRDWSHARSLDSANHPTRNWAKGFHGSLKHLIPEGWRVCGENLYAKHSIYYTELDTYFEGFSIWDEDNVCRSWDETLMWFEELGIKPVPTLYRGPFVLKELEGLAARIAKLTETHEGFVVRITDAYHYDRFHEVVAKWVRRGHIQTDEHWTKAPIIPNGLKKK